MRLWHAFYTVGGTVKEVWFRAGISFGEAEARFKRLYPEATYWEIG